MSGVDTWANGRHARETAAVAQRASGLPGTRDIRIALISTYPPRVCGIATFSSDLREALLGVAPGSEVDVVAVERDVRPPLPGVIARVRQDVRGDYVAAARALERRDTDVVLLQHEYGIFGGSDGAHVLSLVAELRVPYVVTLHTVLERPSEHQSAVLRELCSRATLVIVFTETARRIAVEAGVCRPEQVRVVPHGGPTALLPRPAGNGSARPAVASLGGRRVLSTFGLLSPGKGVETAIEAMATIVERHPDALLLVAGRTHPEVVARDGERYRLSLERLTRDLGLLEHVRFDDRFLSVEELAVLLAATDVYLTPYRSPEQIVSGALTFAIVAGCPVVSTPYRYAQDLLGGGAGVLVPFDDPSALAAAVGALLEDDERLAAMRLTAATLGASMTWPAVGRQLVDVLGEAIELGPAPRIAREEPTGLPPLRLDHLDTLVDDVGIVEHADGIVPDRRSGYCVDDMARLAIVALALRRITGEPRFQRMLGHALGFLRHAWEPGVPGMHNRMGYDRRWQDEPHLGDHVGRAAWSLGEVLGAEPLMGVHEPARLLLADLLDALPLLEHPRSQAYAVLGLARAAPADTGARGQALLEQLAARLYRSYQACRSDEWRWFMDTLAYDDARLPQALIAAGVRLGDDALVEAGLEALDWFGTRCGLAAGPLVLLGGVSRDPLVPAPPVTDEQPLDAAALAEAEVEAFALSGAPEHARRTIRSFEWFLGANRLGVPVYDFATGGCHDGVGSEALNLNEGAESTLAFLQALIAIDASGVGASIAQP